MHLLYNISYEIAGVVLLLVLAVMLRTQYIVQSKSNKMFRQFIYLMIFAVSLDIFTAITISYAAAIPVWLNVIANTLYLLISVVCEYAAVQYVNVCINRTSKYNRIINKVVLILYAAIVVLNLWTGCLFSFSHHVYEHGPLYVLMYVVLFYYVLNILVIAIKEKTRFTVKQRCANIVFVIISLFCAFLQGFIVPNVLLSFFGAAIAAMIMTFSLETPDYQNLEYLRKNLQLEVEKQTATAVERQKKIEVLSLQMIEALAQAIDAKDDYTKGHSTRVADYAVLLARKLGWQEEQIYNLRYMVILHDIGKIGIPDNVLKKPGALTDEEYVIIQSHTTIGGDILKNISNFKDGENIARQHHERYDGSGYPNRLKGEEIDENARLVCIVDAYDAMTSKRVYRKALPREVVRNELVKGRGTQFDPEMLDVFLEMFDACELTLDSERVDG